MGGMEWNGWKSWGREQSAKRLVYVEQLAQFEIKEKNRRKTSDMVK
jgi:hypothetical protein